MRAIAAACAMGVAVILAGCNNAGAGPALPDTPEGAQAPVELTLRPPERQAQINPQERTGFETLVRRYLDGAQERFASGMSETPDAPEQIVTMQPSHDFRWYVNLTAGTRYTFIGACDDDCTNVDFELIAPQGGVVASDLLQDDFPVASYTPSENGRYIARLLMMECSIAPCFAGARVLSAAPAQPEAAGAASSKP